MSERRREEIVVVGGGLAGSSAACILADAGRRVLLIEREPAPRHKVCGEFLSIEAQTCLARLGIDLDALGASRISSLRLIRRRRMTEIDLPFLARGLSRLVLDEAMLQHAQSRGAHVVRGRSVRSLSPGAAGICIEAGPHDSLFADAVFLATGKHDVRGWKRNAAGAVNDLIGFKTHFRLMHAQRQALDGAVEVVLFAGGYAGLQMVEQNRANLCLVVSRKSFEQVGKSWDRLLDHIRRECPHLADRLHGALPLLERPLSIFQIPYGFLHAASRDERQDLFRLGDQVGVIPSFAGEGMAIALHSGCLAASTFLTHGKASSIFHHRIRADIHRSIRLASILNRTVRHAAGQEAIFHLCRLWPSVMRHAAILTRVREASTNRASTAS